MVVLSPWPVCTTVSPGNAPSRPDIDRRIVGKSEYERPVAPGPPANSVSPLNTVPVRDPALAHTSTPIQGVPRGVQRTQLRPANPHRITV